MMRVLLFGLLMCFGAPAFALDYNDHAAVCEAIEANTKHALSNDKAGRQKMCACEVTEMKNHLEADMYRLWIDWKIDAEAFARNNAEHAGELLTQVMSASVAVMKACK